MGYEKIYVEVKDLRFIRKKNREGEFFYRF